MLINNNKSECQIETNKETHVPQWQSKPIFVSTSQHQITKTSESSVKKLQEIPQQKAGHSSLSSAWSINSRKKLQNEKNFRMSSNNNRNLSISIKLEKAIRSKILLNKSKNKLIKSHKIHQELAANRKNSLPQRSQTPFLKIRNKNNSPAINSIRLSLKVAIFGKLMLQLRNRSKILKNLHQISVKTKLLFSLHSSHQISYHLSLKNSIKYLPLALKFQK